MQHPDEGTIHAWLDGQLSADEGAALEAHAAQCADCAATIAEARGLIAAASRIVSALDVVPGGVIPARAIVRRPWYASTQLRAAAAVLFVAGASLVVLQGRDSAPVEETASRMLATRDTVVAKGTPQSAPVVSSPEERVPLSKAAQNDRAMQPPRVDKKSPASPEKQGTTSKRVAADAAAPSAANQNAAAASERDLSRRAAVGAILKVEPVVVTGVATLGQAGSDELKLLRTDTAGTVKVRVYQVARGVEVTLTETMPVQFPTATAMQRERRLQPQRIDAAGQRENDSQTEATTRAKAASTSTLSSSARKDTVTTRSIVSITWSDPATGRTYSLRGPLSRERLEELRKEIEQKKR